ncbi:EpsG family protein [Ligilactobacillus cholophilus]|uniref:EpsG family protein n=1 Tax=Ligilactobacillus cholophilus TaxID=3050131 RepID=UPI0025B0B6D9|nr:EpsG family protein [Ligilactobacillus cholophilus]
MAIYLWLIAFILGASPLQKQYKKIYLTLCLFFIWILIAFRSYFIGNDTLTYVGSFSALANTSLSTYGNNFFSILFSKNRFEYGYVVLNKIIYFFSKNPRWLLIVSATIIVILLGYILYKYCEDSSLALIIFVTMGFMSGSMSQIRQYIAWAICIFSIKYIIKNNFVKYLITIIIAMLFHISAVIFFPLYWISKLKFNFLKCFSFSIIVMPIFIYFTQFSNLVGSIISSYDNYDGQIANNGTTGYLSITINLITFILLLLLAVYLYKNQNILNNQIINLSLWMLFCGCLVMILSYKFSQFTRLSTYFTCAIMFLFPNGLNQLKSTELKNIVKILLISFMILYFVIINTLKPLWTCIVPYHFMTSWWGY